MVDRDGGYGLNTQYWISMMNADPSMIIPILNITSTRVILKWRKFKSTAAPPQAPWNLSTPAGTLVMWPWPCKDNQQIESHKVILAAASPFFHRIWSTCEGSNFLTWPWDRKKQTVLATWKPVGQDMTALGYHAKYDFWLCFQSWLCYKKKRVNFQKSLTPFWSKSSEICNLNRSG